MPGASRKARGGAPPPNATAQATAQAKAQASKRPLAWVSDRAVALLHTSRTAVLKRLNARGIERDAAEAHVGGVIATGRCKELVPEQEFGHGLDDDYVTATAHAADLILVFTAPASGAASGAASRTDADARALSTAFVCARVGARGRDEIRGKKERRASGGGSGGVFFVVDAACSAAGGTTGLFERLHALADAHGASVALNAVPTALGFYTRPELGYEFRATCAPDALVVDASPVAGRRVAPAAVRAELGSFMSRLHRAGLSADTRAVCKPRLAADKIFENHCWTDGYLMHRCPAAPSSSPASPRRAPSPRRARSPARSPAPPGRLKRARSSRR